MHTALRLTTVLLAAALAPLAAADVPLIYCVGSQCGGPGPTDYAYAVDSAGYPMVEFCVGTNDLDVQHYRNVLTPPGWQFAVEPVWMYHIHGVETPHGEISPGPCWCLTAGRVHWWTDDPDSALECFVFGFNHGWVAEDVGFDLLTRLDGSPPQYYDFHEDWDAPVGMGAGPLHGPYFADVGDLNCDGALNGFDIDPFVLILFGQPPYDEYYDLYPNCDHALADINADGMINGFDIDAFIDLLTSD